MCGQRRKDIHWFYFSPQLFESYLNPHAASAHETSFKLHVNGKCVTVYDKEKLLLTECQPNLVGHGFKKNKINNNLIAKVETGTEPIMSDSNYPYPYEMIKSDLTSQCLNIDLKNNLTMQDCNPDKVDQFFRSHYTQKS